MPYAPNPWDPQNIDDAATHLSFLKRLENAVVSAGGGGNVNSVTATDPSIVVGGTAAAPTVATGTLDVIAAQHPAAADWSNSSHKITNLATPTVATDAATKAYADANGPVASVFTRTGAVAATTGDYTAAQVTNAADKASGSTQTFTATVAAPIFSASGAAGTTNGARLVGGMNTGAPPTSGTFIAGDVVSDTTGKMWVCVTGGTPGTWGNVNGTVTFNLQVGTTYTLVAADQGNVVSMNNSNANTVTIPTHASVPFPVGTNITFRQAGTGNTTVAAAGGVTLNSRGGVFRTAGQYAYADVYQVATDVWELTGDIIA